jgi:hypothetical protein
LTNGMKQLITHSRGEIMLHKILRT